MKKLLCILAALIACPVLGYTLLFSGTLASRTITWSHDGSCASDMLPQLQRAFRIYDRVLSNVTISYLGIDPAGHNRADPKSTVSCHTKSWMEARGAWPAGAYVDHDGPAGARTFDMVYCQDAVYCVEPDGRPWGFGSALHEGGHVLGLNHPPNTSANNWSAVFNAPFCWMSPTTCNPHIFGWTEYLSNDDLVGLATFYGGQPAICTPYLSLSNKLYLPFIPLSGAPDPGVSVTGYWAVLQLGANGALNMLQMGPAANYRYDCGIHFNGAGKIVGTGYRESSAGSVKFQMINNDPTGANKTSWAITVL